MLPKTYGSSENKERVRVEDTELVKKEFLRKKKKLSYLGMPSGEMRDILAWRQYIDRCTAVEIDENQRSELALNMIRNDLQDKVCILFGDVEEILVRGKDQFGNRLDFPYDIVFLDLFGTILYKGLNRIKAIKSLIEKQKGHSFLLLLTFNIRERRFCKNAIMEVFEKIQKELAGFYVHDELTQRRIEKVIAWYESESTSEMFRQKLFVPYFIKTTGEEYGFWIHAYSPIFYKGFNNSPMIHFAFKLTPEFDSPTKAVSKQSILDIVDLNLKEASKGRVFVKTDRAPCLNI